jgi:hypothetical protein
MLAAHSHVAGIDSVLVERHRADPDIRATGCAVVMKISDNRRGNVPISANASRFRLQPPPPRAY